MRKVPARRIGAPRVLTATRRATDRVGTYPCKDIIASDLSGNTIEICSTNAMRSLEFRSLGTDDQALAAALRKVGVGGFALRTRLSYPSVGISADETVTAVVRERVPPSLFNVRQYKEKREEERD